MLRSVQRTALSVTTAEGNLAAEESAYRPGELPLAQCGLDDLLGVVREAVCASHGGFAGLVAEVVPDPAR
jgi:hypothetical protein